MTTARTPSPGDTDPDDGAPQQVTVPGGRRCRPDGPRDRGGVVTRFVVSIPDRFGLLFFWAAIAIAGLLFLKAFDPYLMIAITVVLTVATWRLAPEPVRDDDRHLAGTLAAISLVGAWVWMNLPYYEQMLGINRDPAVYALRGWWLTRHSSPVLPAGLADRGAAGIYSAAASAPSFPEVRHTLYPQSASLVPGFFAVAGRLLGLRAMLSSNLVLGGVALLLLYALARRVMGPLWGLVPMVSLAVSMPMIYFSRATYTEPAAMIAVLGGLVVLAAAFRTGRLTLFALAGAMIGVSSLARIDGVLAVIGAIGAVAIAGAGALDPARRARLRWAVLATAAGGLVTVLAGWYDLTENSPLYYTSQVPKLRPLFELYAVVVVVGLVVSWVPLDGPRRWLAEHRGGLGRVAMIFVLLVSAVMVSRPLWWTGHFNDNPLVQQSIRGLQAQQGLPLDGSRSYDEQSVTWLAWYFTWPVVVLAAIGLGLLLVRIARRRDTTALGVFAVFGVAAALYLNDVSITPDQIWASRRFLPVVFPVLVIAATYTAYRLWNARRRGVPTRWRVLAVPLALIVAVGPALQFRQLFQQGDYTGEFRAAQLMCAAIDRGESGARDRLVVFAGGPPPTGFWSMTAKVLCDADVVTATSTTPQRLAAIKRNWSGRPVTVVTFDLGSVTWTTGSAPPAVYSGTVTVWDAPLTRRPTRTRSVGLAFWAGTLGDDGVLTPVSAG